MTRPKADKPNKPYKDFPLFPHASGTWCKKVRGKHKHFGPWADYRAALRAYEQYMAGARERPAASIGGTLTIDELSNLFLTEQLRRSEIKAIKLRSFRDLHGAITAFIGSFDSARPANSFGPDDFALYGRTLAAYGPDYRSRLITLVKQMFKWGADNQKISPVAFGTAFKKDSESSKRRIRTTSVKTWEPWEVLAMIDAAEPHVRAMIYLGINCAFGNTDVSDLPEPALDLAKGFITFPRPKTGVLRRCAAWPETVKALREAIASRPEPADKSAHSDRVFLTHFGVPFVRESQSRKAGAVAPVTVVDSVGLLTGKLIRSLQSKPGSKFKANGRRFYALRHTFRTWAEEIGEDNAAKRIMGHALGGMSDKYVHAIPDEKLKRVTDHVRRRLLGLDGRGKRKKNQ